MFIDVHETEQHAQVQGYKGCKLCAHLFVVSCINGKAFQLMMSQIVAGQAFQLVCAGIRESLQPVALQVTQTNMIGSLCIGILIACPSQPALHMRL